ncbi:MAG: hypothetical protein LBT08_08910 [Synergistaceae bacterium]|jgi:hypothetical protein|nr:hypothetical protein [Synergistaceae bacterium]
MYYRREGRRRRRNGPSPEESNGNERPKRFGGGWMTFMSFIAIMAVLAVVKARNPEFSIGPMILMIGGTAFGCLVLFRLGGRR